MLNRWCLVGAPSSAGAHTPGVEQAPAALREAGLLDALRRRGAEVDDHGDVPGFRWRPDVTRPRAQNAAAVARVAAAVAEAVGVAVDHGGTPLVMGGDCTVTIGLVAGYARTGTPPALVYVDGGPTCTPPKPGRTETSMRWVWRTCSLCLVTCPRWPVWGRASRC